MTKQFERNYDGGALPLPGACVPAPGIQPLDPPPLARPLPRAAKINKIK